jgi:hypothetical protein
VPYVHTTWLAGSADLARTNKGNGVITVALPDGVTIGAVEGDHAESLGRWLVELGEQVQVLNGTRRTDQDELIVKAFLDGEGLGQSSAALFHRFIAYRDGVHAHPFNELVVAELAEVDQ